MIDGEWIRSTLRYSYSLKDYVSVGIALPVVGRTGGFTDYMIEDFHNAFQLGNARRDEFPRNRSRVTFRNHQSAYTVAEGESWGMGDISAFMAAQLTQGTVLLPAITVQCEVFSASGDQNELRGNGAAAFALSAVASKRLGASPFVSFMGAGVQYCDSDDILAIEIRDEQYSGMLGLEYHYSPSLGLLVQYLISSPVARNYYAFSEPSHEVSVGFKWHFGRASSLQLAIVENVAVFKNSADIGVHFALGRRL
jgi:hypothetical protein